MLRDSEMSYSSPVAVLVVVVIIIIYEHTGLLDVPQRQKAWAHCMAFVHTLLCPENFSLLSPHGWTISL